MANDFYNRNTQEQTFEPDKDFIGFIERFTVDDSLFEVNPNSILYELAINQINTTNFVKREDTPEWVCGYVDLEKGISYISSEQQRLNDFLSTNTSLVTAFSLTSIPPVRFSNDKCLQYGVPGSYAYSKCIESITTDASARDEFGLNNIDFGANLIFIDSIIESTISDLESGILAELENSILEAFSGETSAN